MGVGVKGSARAVLRYKLPELEKHLDEVIDLCGEAGAGRLHHDLMFIHSRLRRLRRLIEDRRNMPGHCVHCGARSCYCCPECGLNVVEGHEIDCSSDPENDYD